MSNINDIDRRLTALEGLVNGLIANMNMHNGYVDADIDGCRQSIGEVTPYVATQKGYYGESEKTFYDAPVGNITVFFDRYDGQYTTERIDDRLIVHFDTLTQETNITISII